MWGENNKTALAAALCGSDEIRTRGTVARTAV